MLEELTSDIRQVAQGIVDRAQIERGAGWINAFANEYPLAHGLLISSLYKTPKDVMKFLCMIVPELRRFKGNEHVLRYIAALQEELRGKSDDSIRTDRTPKSILPVRRS